MTITRINMRTGEQTVLQEDAPSFVTPEQELAAERTILRASAMQVRLVLLAAGRLEEVEAIVANASVHVQIAWDKAVEFRRLSPTIAALQGQLDPPMSDTALDDLFRAAMEIEA